MQKYLIIALAIVGYAASAAIDTVVEIQTPPLVSSSTPAPLSVNENCHQPKETGRCFALFQRYAYNVDTYECEEFIYGGCAGNQNNFESKEECERFCLQGENAEAESSTAAVVSEAVSELATTVLPDVNDESSSSTLSTSTESAKVVADADAASS